MPLVSGNSVGIDITGNSDSVIAASNRVIKEMDRMKAATQAKAKEVEAAAKREQDAIQKTSQKYSGSLVPGLEKAMGATTGFLSANTALIGGLVAIGVAAGKSYKEFQKYAGEVENLARVSQTGAQEASILLQVLDDYKISAQDVTAATKKMKDNGLVPTLETLAQLADGYNAIEDPAKKLQYANDNLGKSYEKYLKVLEAGGDALRENAGEVNKSLILTDEQIKKADQARLAMDALADTWQGVKVATGAWIGEQIVAVKSTADLTKEFLKLNGVVQEGRGSGNKYAEIIKLLPAQMERGRAMAALYAGAIENNTASFEENTAALQATSEANGNFLSLLGTVQSQTESFTEKNEELRAKFEELRDAQSQYTAGSDEYRAIGEEINGVAGEIGNLATEYELAGKKIAFELITMKTASDGWQAGEFENLLSLGEQWGIYDKSVIAAATAMETSAQKIADSLGAPIDKTQVMLDKVRHLEMLNGRAFDFYVTIHTKGGIPAALGDVGLGGDAPVIITNPDTGNETSSGAGGVTAQWRGGTVGAYASGGDARNWAVVGDRQGNFIPGISELIHGTARVFDSKTSEKMLRSGAFGKVKGLAFGGDTDGYTNPAPIPPIYTPPPSRPGGRAGGASGIMLSSAGGGGGAGDVAIAGAQAVAAMQMQTELIASRIERAQGASQAVLERIESVLIDNPVAVGKQVGYEMGKSS